MTRLERLTRWLSNAKESVWIVSPYVSLEALQRALEDVPEDIDVTVITSWRPGDLASGVSKPELYELCEERGWKLRADLGDGPFVHIKAYVKDEASALMGSANLTNLGMGNLGVGEKHNANIESLVEVGLQGDEGELLRDNIQRSFWNTHSVDRDLHQYVVEYCNQLPTQNAELPLFDPPPFKDSDEEDNEAEVGDEDPFYDDYVMAHAWQTDFLGARAMEEVIAKMPPRPGIDQILGMESWHSHLGVKGLRYGEIRKIVREAVVKWHPESNGYGMREDPLEEYFWTDKLDFADDIVDDTIDGILSENAGMDQQTGPPRHHTKCLVWKLDLIINEEIRRHIHPYLGLKMSEIGLDDHLCSKTLSGSGSRYIRTACLGLLPPELRELVGRLSSWDATIALTEDGRVKENRPVGPRIILSELELEERPSLLDTLSMPSFCVYRSSKGVTLGDVELLGFGFWEPKESTRDTISHECRGDIERILANQERLLKGDKTFLENESDRDYVFAKVKAGGGKGVHPLGSEERPMSHYMTKSLLGSIAKHIM